MANETISTSIDELASIAVAEARLVAQNRIDLTRTLTVRDVPVGSISARFPKYTAQSAAALTEGNSASNTELTTTGVVLTPSTNAVWKTVVTDIAGHAAPQLFTDIGRIGADAILKKKNQDIFALYDGFSNEVGTINTDLTLTTVRAGVKKLIQNGATGDIYLVITPEVLEDFYADLASQSAGGAAISDNTRDAVLRGEMPLVYGVRPLVVTSGISEAGDVKCGLYTAQALGYASMWDFKVEIARNAAAVGYDVVVSSAYAVGEIDDTQGVEVLCDGADV